MVIPVSKRQLGDTVRSGFLPAALLIVSIACSLLLTTTTHALPSVEVNLPTGKLLSPVTNTVNGVTDTLSIPVTVNSTSPKDKPTAETASQLVTVTPQQSASQATQRLLRQSPVTAPVVEPAAPQPQVSPQDQQATKKQPVPAKSSDTRASDTSTLQPVTSGFAVIFGSAIPSIVQNSARTILGHDINTFPLIVSVGIFIAMLAAITVIIYTANRNKSFISSDGRMARLAQNYDLIQLSVLAIVVIGSGIIALYLVLAK